SQQYLTLEKEKAIIKFLLLIANLRYPVRIKFIYSLAFSIAYYWFIDILIKPLGKNWP
ncbi:uncharacterized protein K441DRAFT_549020, partial [Cenococcum geophilum 1.58]|uniref:uncharacterized protein n=1 Tax=Cenococcum geophilum 1.58 TaxID=794803 RepID=UPI00358E03D2